VGRRRDVTETARQPVFLVGFMGCGKTSCGSALAELLDSPFVDLDRLVEQNEGRAIERMFAESGEDAFRAAEERALLSLGGRRELVVACGGGTFARDASRRWMKASGRTVWLDAPLDSVRRRVGQDPSRPLWSADDPIALRAMFERRRAVYALCHFRVAVGSKGPSRLAEEIVQQFL
jgi:shikimate kinase